MKNLDFMELIKIVPDEEKEMLLKIQHEIEKNGIDKERVLELTKDLSDSQRERLEELYIEQIKKLNDSIEEHKKKIIKMKSELENKKSR